MRRSINYHYTPMSLDDMLLTHKTRGMLKDMLETNTVEHILIAGGPATGKSSLARLLSNFPIPLQCHDPNSTGQQKVQDILHYSLSSPLYQETDRIITVLDLDRLDESAQSLLARKMETMSLHSSIVATTQNPYRVHHTLRSHFLFIDLSAEHGREIVRKQWEEKLSSIHTKLHNTPLDKDHLALCMSKFPDARQMLYALEYGMTV